MAHGLSPPTIRLNRSTSFLYPSAFDRVGQVYIRGGDEMHGVAVAAHHARCRRDIVGDDEVAALLRELLPSMLDHMLGFGRKAHHEGEQFSARCEMVARMSGFSISDRFGNVPSFFLIFCSPAFATPVGHGGGEDADIGGQGLLRPASRGRFPHARS